jgi:ankyrin repeat protein
MAAMSGNVEVVQFLISKGADVNAKDNNGNTPLDYATISGNTAVIRYLSSVGGGITSARIAGVRTTPPNNQRRTLPMDAFWQAVRWREFQDVRRYIEQEGVNVNAKDKDGMTALHLVVLFAPNFDGTLTPDVKFAKYLIDKGADVDAKDNEGLTTLHHAATNGVNIAFVRFIVSVGANVNTKDMHGFTPLHLAACFNGDVEFVQFLVSKGANVNARMNNGKTPLDLAREKGNVAVIRYLSSIGGR